MDMPIMPTGEQLLEVGKSSVSSAVKSTVSDISDSVSGQIGVKNEANVQNQAQSQTQASDQTQVQGESAQVQTERTKEMVREFYSPSGDLSQNSAQTQAVTEQQQLESVRKKLLQERHNENYYDPLFAYEHNLGKAESKTEELEREKQQEMQDLDQKEADKPPPLAVARAQTHVEAPLGTG